MRKIFILLILCLVLFLTACAAPEPVASATPTATPKPTPVPTPVPITTEVVFWADAEAPDFYNPVENEDKLPLFAFTNTTGTVHYRAAVEKLTLQGEEVLSRETAVMPYDPENGIPALSEDVSLVSPENDQAGSGLPLALDLENWQLRPGYTATEAPGHIVTPEGEHFVRIHWYTGDEGKFYPADDTGSMRPGSLPVELDALRPSWYPDDVPEDGEYRAIVYKESQSTVIFQGHNGEWEAVRTIACSTAKSTPTGDFHTSDYYRYRALFGGRGQYAVRITGVYLFHSVPIHPRSRELEQGLGTMLLDQYEGLGTPISRGCIRMPVVDAKWIYDNLPRGTSVTIARGAGPECPEVPAIRYEAPYVTGDNLGWDPTDPDVRNPYYWLTHEKHRDRRIEYLPY